MRPQSTPARWLLCMEAMKEISNVHGRAFSLCGITVPDMISGYPGCAQVKLRRGERGRRGKAISLLCRRRSTIAISLLRPHPRHEGLVHATPCYLLAFRHRSLLGAGRFSITQDRIRKGPARVAIEARARCVCRGPSPSNGFRHLVRWATRHGLFGSDLQDWSTDQRHGRYEAAAGVGEKAFRGARGKSRLAALQRSSTEPKAADRDGELDRLVVSGTPAPRDPLLALRYPADRRSG